MDGQEISKSDFKRDRMERALRRARTQKIMAAAGVVVVIILLIWGGVVWSRRSAGDAPGQTLANQGQEHVALDYQFSYNSNPPTSGPHFASPANWGVYDYEVHDKLFIHNLEHGGIWISYRPSVSGQAIGDLKSIVDGFGGSKIVMAPRSANDSDVVIAAWTRVLKLNLAGGILSDEQESQIRAFYKAHKNRGPEFVPDVMPGVDPKSVQ